MAVRQHRWTISLLPLVAAVGIAALIRASLPIRDWNPYLTAAGVLAGDWRDGRAVLRLHANGRYVCDGAACQALGATGSWKRSGDFFVAFQPDRPGDPVEWRVSRRAGRFQFVAGRTKGDPDSWSPRLTFEHRAPAS